MPSPWPLTTIPPRFDKLGATLASLKRQKDPADRILLNIPRSYRRFRHIPEQPLLSVRFYEEDSIAMLVPSSFEHHGCVQLEQFDDVLVANGMDLVIAPDNARAVSSTVQRLAYGSARHYQSRAPPTLS